MEIDTPTRRKSLFERLIDEDSPKVRQDIALGKRVGLYRMRNQLGSGNFAKVKLATHLLTKEKVAIKIIDKGKLDDQSRKILSREIMCMEQLSHRSIIRLFEVIETFSHLYLVMECAAEGDIQNRVNKEGPFSDNDGKRFFVQIASAIHYMHNIGVVHRDLKAENVFFSSRDHIKVGDFGFSTFSSPSEHLDTFCGSPPYAAPELFQEDTYVGSSVDIWALGVMLYFMMSGNMPFRGESVHEIKAKVTNGSYHMPRNLSLSCQSLISGMLMYYVKDRYLMDDIVNSEWVADIASCTNAFSQMSQCVKINEPTLLDKQCHNSIEPLDTEVLNEMDHYGVPTQNFDSINGEPRNSIAGIYRILLHHKIAHQEVEPETIDPSTTESRKVPELSEGQSRKLSEFVAVKSRKISNISRGSPSRSAQSKICLIL